MMEWRDIKSGEESQEPQEQERMTWEVIGDRTIRIAGPHIPLVVAVVEKFPKNEALDIDYRMHARLIAAAPAMIDLLMDIILDGMVPGSSISLPPKMIDEIGSIISEVNGIQDEKDM